MRNSLKIRCKIGVRDSISAASSGPSSQSSKCGAKPEIGGMPYTRVRQPATRWQGGGNLRGKRRPNDGLGVTYAD